MNLYVVRHGQTDWNIKGILQGSTDIPLNDTGIQQAEQLSKTLENIDFNSQNVCVLFYRRNLDNSNILYN